MNDSFEKWRSMLKDGGIPISSVQDPEQMVMIDPNLYFKLLHKTQLLYTMGLLTQKEVGRVIFLLDSKDPESWIVVEETIKQKFLSI